jgi:hypothetical protein
MASRAARSSSSFKARNTTSRAIPGVRPTMLRYCRKTPTVPAITNRTSSHFGGRRHWRQVKAARQAKAAPAASDSQNGICWVSGRKAARAPASSHQA